MAETELDFSLLPDQLQPLASLIAKYGEGDDQARGDAMARASADELRELASAVDPHWDAINAFLDENMEQIGSRQDLALSLDGFSQAAMEAERELAERGEG
jgi:hypothetical protein